MTEQISTRRKGLTTTLGIAIAAALTPSGKIISSAVAGAVAVSVTGYAIHEHKPPPHQKHASVAAKGIPAYVTAAGPLPLVYTSIESEGHEVPVLLTTGADNKGSQGSAPSLRVSGGPIGGAGNPNQSFPPVRPTFGEPAPHPKAPESPGPKKPDFPPVPPPKPLPCSESNKLLGLCEVKPPEKLPCSKEIKLLALCDDISEDEASAPDDEAVIVDSMPSEPNVILLEKLLTEEFEDVSPGVTPPGGTEPTIPGKPADTEGNTGGDTPLQTLAINNLDQIRVSVPEPSLISLMFLGVAAMAWTGRRRSAPPKQTRG